MRPEELPTGAQEERVGVTNAYQIFVRGYGYLMRKYTPDVEGSPMKFEELPTWAQDKILNKALVLLEDEDAYAEEVAGVTNAYRIFAYGYEYLMCKYTPDKRGSLMRLEELPTWAQDKILNKALFILKDKTAYAEEVVGVPDAYKIFAHGYGHMIFKQLPIVYGIGRLASRP